jgi:hypothetical protein
VFQKTYTTVGAGTGSANGQRSPLNVAALIRCSTAARSVKNHPIYLFSYIHDVSVDHSHNWLETLDTPQKTAIGVYANQWLTGFSDGAITVKRASPRGAAATSVIVEEYVTHRDFPYTTSV